MKIISLLIILFITNNALAKSPSDKPWINFQSNYGYEFKYPDCWEIVSSDAYEEETDTKKMKGIFVTEKKCVTKQRDKYVPNGISFSYGETENEKELKKELENLTNFAPKNKSWLTFKRMKIDGGGEALIYIDQHSKLQKQIRWVMELFCNDRKISAVGAAITNPEKELLQKFERGDLAIPDPEKTIFESIRCIEPKLK